MTEGIHGIGFNPASVTNNNTKGSTAEHKEEEKEQVAPEAKAEEKNLAQEDVLFFMSQSAKLSGININYRPVQTPVGIAAGQMFDEFAPLVAQGIRENTNVMAVERAEQFAQEHPEVVQRTEVAMEAFEEEFGAVPAFFNAE